MRRRRGRVLRWDAQCRWPRSCKMDEILVAGLSTVGGDHGASRRVCKAICMRRRVGNSPSTATGAVRPRGSEMDKQTAE